MPLIDAVGRIDIDQVTDDHGRAIRHVVGKNVEFLDHVEFPDDIRIRLVSVFFLLETLVLVRVQAVQSSADDRASVGNVIDVLALNTGGRANTFVRPVIHLSSRILVVYGLPQEFARLFVEAHHDAFVEGSTIGIVGVRREAVPTVAWVLVICPAENPAPRPSGHRRTVNPVLLSIA